MLQLIQISVLAICFTLIVSLPSTAHGQLANLHIPGAKLTVNDRTVLIKLDSNFSGNMIELPRLAAPIRSLKWLVEDPNSNLKIQPELTTWQLIWDKPPKGQATIELQLDAEPLLIAECKPVQAGSDGSLFLPAHMATTSGDKIRYEPQPFKNTVGYWAGMQNSASWTFNLAKPGRFNVAILQGCGNGNGGSIAELNFYGPGTPVVDKSTAAAQLEFEVLETGHFQNFVWRHLGEISLQQAGDYQLRINPKNIKRGALMDVRAVHLIRLP